MACIKTQAKHQNMFWAYDNLTHTKIKSMF